MQKKIPMRQCVGCKEMKPKMQLIRVVKSPEGVLSLDFKGKAPGRGAYLCSDSNCLKRAQKTKALERALDCSIDASIYEELMQKMEEADHA